MTEKFKAGTKVKIIGNTTFVSGAGHFYELGDVVELVTGEVDTEVSYFENGINTYLARNGEDFEQNIQRSTFEVVGGNDNA